MTVLEQRIGAREAELDSRKLALDCMEEDLVRVQRDQREALAEIADREDGLMAGERRLRDDEASYQVHAFTIMPSPSLYVSTVKSMSCVLIILLF